MYNFNKFMNFFISFKENTLTSASFKENTLTIKLK